MTKVLSRQFLAHHENVIVDINELAEQPSSVPAQASSVHTTIDDDGPEHKTDGIDPMPTDADQL